MEISAEKIWNAAQEHLRVKLSRDTFNMWFAPLRACAVDGRLEFELKQYMTKSFPTANVPAQSLAQIQSSITVAVPVFFIPSH